MNKEVFEVLEFIQEIGFEKAQIISKARLPSKQSRAKPEIVLVKLIKLKDMHDI
jgi:hypothetical protein